MMNEKQFQEAVLQTAKLFGWKVAHFRAARTAKGWATPVAADGKGWPDLVLVGNGRVLFRELKTDKGVLTQEQQEWGEWLTANRQDWAVWRPKMWTALVADLSSGKAKGI